MDANTWTVEKLFETPVRYLLPLYQRPYVWSKERQWDPLWTDIQELADRWLEYDALGTDADSKTPVHFLGAVVLQQVPTATGTLELRNVIDGQQRLITLQLVLHSLKRVVDELGTKDDAALLKNLTLNTMKIESVHDQFKVWPTNVDQDAFVGAMTEDGDQLSHADSNLIRCHDSFYKSIRKWTLDQGVEFAPRRLHGLTVSIMGRIQIVVIDLDDNDNPQVIFETLNDRGEPLLAGDLIKNELLRRVEKELGNEAMDDMYEASWKEFDTDSFWREEMTQGRFKRPRLDVMLFHWLTLRTKQLASVGQEFLAFRHYVASTKTALPEVAADLRSVSRTWRMLEEEPRITTLGVSLGRLRVLDAGQVRPLVLFIFQDAGLSPEDKLAAIQMVESWVVRRAICKLPTMGMNRFVVDLLGKLSGQCSEEVVGTMGHELASQESIISLWPTDQDVVNDLVDKPLYGRMAQARVRLVLEALENQRRSKKTEELAPEKLTIEHIMPRGWTSSAWPLPSSDANGDRRREMINTLGNLTLLTDSLNSSQSNGDWTTKRVGLKESVLRLNRELDELPIWDEEQARRRGVTLANNVLEIWAGPITSPNRSARNSDDAVVEELIQAEDPNRQATEIEMSRANQVLSDWRWTVIDQLIARWLSVAFDTTSARRIGIDWGVTAYPGGDRLVAVHVGAHDALSVNVNGAVKIALVESTIGRDEPDSDSGSVQSFDNLMSAIEALHSDEIQRGASAWWAENSSDALPAGYSNPALAQGLTAAVANS